MTAIFRYADDLLRGRDATAAGDISLARLIRLALLVVVFGMAYGAVMGAFGGVIGQRFLQVIFSASKVPLLLLVTFLLGLPSFFVINTLMGLRDDFAQAVRALIATQAGLTIILASLAPFTALWYASSADYEAALLFNAVMFGTASLAAQFLLRRFYRPLVAKDPRHRTLLRAWLVIYAFVGVQMAWVLRPFIGDPSKPTTFFREGAWGNAYVEIAHIVERAIGW